MFLKSIRLIHFGCFDDLTLSFARKDDGLRKWTLLVGENGTGKSVLLKAIAMITADVEALADLLGNPTDWIKAGSNYGEIEATFVENEFETRTATIRIERGDTTQDVVNRVQSPRELFVVGYGSARRFGAQGNNRAQAVGTLFDTNAALLPPKHTSVDLEKLGRRLDPFLPEIVFEAVNDFGDLCFATTNGVLPLHALGDGYQSVAAWITDFCMRASQRFDGLSSPLEAPGLLLIDEIDLHIHPTWQQRLIATLDAELPNVQIVATTHAPITAQQVGPDELHYLTRVQSGVEIEQVAADPRRLLVNQLLLTDIFGLESDESLVVQQKKALYRELAARMDRSAADEDELAALKRELNEIPSGGRSNLTIQREQLELLGDILQDLKAGRS